MINIFFSSILMSFLNVSFITRNQNYRFKKFIISVLLYTFIVFFSYFYFHYTRFFITIIALSIIGFRVLNIPLINSIVSSVTSFLIIAISEIIVFLILKYIFSLSLIDISSSYFGKFYINLSIFVIASLIMSVLGEKLYYKNSIFNLKLALIMFLIFMSMSLLIHYVYFSASGIDFAITHLVFVITLIIVFIVFINNKNDLYYLKSYYSENLEKIKYYESLNDELRMRNHEFVNDLVIIKDMLDDKVKASRYINKIIKSDIKSDKFLNLPSGGIRGIVQNKLSTSDINVYVDKKFSFNASKNDDICKLLAIFLDNAIESKESFINLNFYEYEIVISNDFLGTIDLNKIYFKGYSKKGGNRGYGVYIANLISKKSKVDFEFFVENDIFNVRIFNIK